MKTLPHRFSSRTAFAIGLIGLGIASPGAQAGHMSDRDLSEIQVLITSYWQFIGVPTRAVAQRLTRQNFKYEIEAREAEHIQLASGADDVLNHAGAASLLSTIGGGVLGSVGTYYWCLNGPNVSSGPLFRPVPGVRQLALRFRFGSNGEPVSRERSVGRITEVTIQDPVALDWDVIDLIGEQAGLAAGGEIEVRGLEYTPETPLHSGSWMEAVRTIPARSVLVCDALTRAGLPVRFLPELDSGVPLRLTQEVILRASESFGTPRGGIAPVVATQAWAGVSAERGLLPGIRFMELAGDWMPLGSVAGMVGGAAVGLFLDNTFFKKPSMEQALIQVHDYLKRYPRPGAGDPQPPDSLKRLTEIARHDNPSGGPAQLYIDLIRG